MYVSREQFETAVARLGELRETGQLRVRNSRNGVSLAIDKRVDGIRPTGDGLYADIFDVLTALAGGVSVEEFVRVRSVAPVDFDEGEDEQVSRAKFEAAAAAFPVASLRPSVRLRAQRRLRRLLVTKLVAVSKRTGRLRRLMNIDLFRRMLGDDGARAAWVALGAQIDPTAKISPSVRMDSPASVKIGAGSRLAGKVVIHSYGSVVIGRNVLINDNTELFTAQHDVDDPRFAGEHGSIAIGDYVWMPHRILVLPGVSIGSHAVIGTGSVVSRDIPDYAVAAGNPATVVRDRARIKYSYVPTHESRAPVFD